MPPQRRSARYSYNFQAYWMEYEYELKEHGFSSEEDYILKLTDMSFEEMFQISKEPRDPMFPYHQPPYGNIPPGHAEYPPM